MKKQAGRISFVLLASILSLLLVLVLFLFNGKNPATTATEFMSALAKGDIKTLSKLSIIKGKSEPEIEQAWAKTFDYSKHYLFQWNIISTDAEGDNANVHLQVTRNALRTNAFEENFGLVLYKKDGDWKVDVLQINREMFPNLPQ